MITCGTDRGKAQSQPQKQENGVGIGLSWTEQLALLLAGAPAIPGVGALAKKAAPAIPVVGTGILIVIVVYEGYQWLTGGKEEKTLVPRSSQREWTEEMKERFREEIIKTGEKEGSIALDNNVLQARNNQKSLEQGMTKNQKEKFQREIEDEKKSRGMKPGDNLPYEDLKDIAEDIKNYYK